MAPAVAATYAYEAPTTSPFYNVILSPLCNWLLQLCVPTRMSPDAISYCGVLSAYLAYCLISPKDGLFSTTAAFPSTCSNVFESILRYPYAISGFAWMLYSILDNLDGKQARRLNVASIKGEFVDHVCDSIVVTFACLMWQLALSPNSFAYWRTPIVLVVGQLPFLTATWGHQILGRLLLGSNLDGISLFTVDELNFLAIPMALLIRQFFPFLWDTSVQDLFQGYLPTHSKFLQYCDALALFLDCRDGHITIGVLLILCIIISVILSNIRVIYCIAEKDNVYRLIPGFFFTFVSLCYKPDPTLLVFPFSLVCMELIAMRLIMPRNKRINWLLWLPGVVQLLLLWLFYNSSKPSDFALNPYVLISLLWGFIWLCVFLARRNRMIQKINHQK